MFTGDVENGGPDQKLLYNLGHNVEVHCSILPSEFMDKDIYFFIIALHCPGLNTILLTCLKITRFVFWIISCLMSTLHMNTPVEYCVSFFWPKLLKYLMNMPWISYLEVTVFVQGLRNYNWEVLMNVRLYMGRLGWYTIHDINFVSGSLHL